MNKFQKRIQITLALITLVFFNSAFAANLFNVTSNGFDLTINTNTNNFYSSAGIKLQTPYYFLAPTNNCIFNYATGFCSFPVGKFTPAKISLLGIPGIVPVTLCLLAKPFSAERPLSCQNYSVPVGSTHPPEPKPPVIIPYAYVVNNLSGQILKCNVAANGSLSNCTPTVTGLNSPADVTVNQSNTFAYVSNEPSSVLKCKIAANGDLVNCIPTGSGFDSPAGIALNPTGNIAYIVNMGNPNNPYISKCTITANGDFLSCTQQPPTPGSTDPREITINPTGTLAYITDPIGHTIYRCEISAVNGDLSPCEVAYQSLTLENPEFVVFKSANVAFFTTGSDVYSCEVDPNGNIINCNPTALTLDVAVGIALNFAGTLAFITSPSADIVSTCEIDSNNLQELPLLRQLNY
ncbi:MAG: hypothetical protein H0U57_12965 [Tatlockia sp.]|nr:hypothetical protein [Tatlockia sp.]